MKHLLLIIVLLPAFSHAAGIYKWVDENGQVHFSSTPPPKQDVTRVGETGKDKADFKSDDGSNHCTSELEYLIGDWKETNLDKKLTFKFYDRNFDDHKDKLKKAYSVRKGQYTVHSGYWSRKGKTIKFDIKKLGRGAEKYKKFKYALIANIDKNNLYLLIQDVDDIKFIRSGRGNIPNCMRPGRKKRKSR